MDVLDEKKYLYLLIIIPIVILLFAFNLYWKKKKQRAFASSDLLNYLSPDKSTFKSILKFTFVVLGLVLIIIGIVNPKAGTKVETVKREGIDIVFAVDVSKSMLAEDVVPSRLEKSKQIVSQIINQLGSDRIGIVAYAGSAYPVLPITTDYGVAKMFLQSMNPYMVSSQGTSLKDAIELASSYFDKDNPTSKLIVLISDGEDHEEGIQDATQKAKEIGAKIITIGVGTDKGGPIPLKVNGVVQNFQRDQNDEVVVTQLKQQTLEEIANETKGGYVYGSNTKEVLEYIQKKLENIEKTEFETTQFADYQSQFQWFLGAGFLLLFIEIFFLERKTSWITKLNLFGENNTKK